MNHLVPFLKHVATIAFVIGVMSLLLKVIDERMPEEKKRRFGQRIDAWTLAIDDATPKSIGVWLRGKKTLRRLLSTLWLFPTVWVGILFLTNHLRFILDHILLLTIALTVLPTVSAYFSSPVDVRYSEAEPGLIGSGDFNPYALLPFIGVVVLVNAYVAAFMYTHNPSDMDMNLREGMALLAALLILGFLYYLPYLIAIFLRYPILLISKCFWWLATYPKGAWAGFVYLATITLGAIRLFI